MELMVQAVSALRCWGKGHKYTYQNHRTLIERGRRSMPGFGASLTDREIEAVLAHIRVGFFSD